MQKNHPYGVGIILGSMVFTSRLKRLNTINFKDIEIKLPNLIKKGIIKDNKGTFEINLTKMGYDKLLGTGKVTKKLNIKIKSFSKSAAEKIKNAGGKIE